MSNFKGREVVRTHALHARAVFLFSDIDVTSTAVLLFFIAGDAG